MCNITTGTTEEFLTGLEKLDDLAKELKPLPIYKRDIELIRRLISVCIGTLTTTALSITRCENTFKHSFYTNNGYKLCFFCPYCEKVDDNAYINETPIGKD